jgi:hypothetical protein
MTIPFPAKYHFIVVLFFASLQADGQKNLYFTGQVGLDAGRIHIHGTKRNASDHLKSGRAGILLQLDSIHGHGLMLNYSSGSITDTNSTEPLALNKAYALSYFYNRQKIKHAARLGILHRLYIGANQARFQNLRPDLYGYSMPDRYDARLYGVHVCWEMGALVRINRRNDFFYCLVGAYYRYNETKHILRYYDGKEFRKDLKTSETNVNISVGFQIRLF